MRPRITLPHNLKLSLRDCMHDVFMDYGYYSQDEPERRLHGVMEFLKRQGIELTITDRASEEVQQCLEQWLAPQEKQKLP